MIVNSRGVLGVIGVVILHVVARAQQPTAAPATPELTAWQAAQKTGTPTAYLEFYKKYPRSSHVKVATGTLRGRYWKQVVSASGPDAAPEDRDGVIVTVSGMSVFMNLSLDQATRLSVIGTAPGTPGEAPKAEGHTFNWVYAEVTGGAIVVGRQRITPLDSVNSTVLLTPDGKRLLGWDVSKATPASDPSHEPTMVKDSNGKYLCGTRCPEP